jgi:hypothetical protein
MAELQAAGCAKVYSEKASGVRGDRVELQKLVDPRSRWPETGSRLD